MIKVVRIVDVIRKAENSKFGAYLVKVTLPNSIYEITAYVKPLPEEDFLVELLTTLLARDLGIPMPEPVLAFSLDGRQILFGSIDAKFPDLSRRLNIQHGNITNTIENLMVFKGLSEWEKMHESIAFDEWIANQDRHAGNVLFDGGKNYMLIDNNLAMRPPFSPLAPINNNQLLNVHLLFNNDELSRQRVKTKISNLVGFFDISLPEKISAKLKKELGEASSDYIDQMVEFLQKRLERLADITSSKVTTKQQSMF